LLLRQQAQEIASLARSKSEVTGMAEEEQNGGMTGVMERNIRVLVKRRQLEEQRKPAQQSVADTITRFTGSMRFVYIHLVLFGG